MWIILGIGSAAFAALVTIFSKMGLKNIDPIFATTIRSIVMAVTLIAVTIFTKKASFASFSQKDFLLIFLSGLAGAASWLCYFIALKTGDTTRVAALDRLSIVFIALASIPIFGLAQTGKNWLGLALIVLGVILATSK